MSNSRGGLSKREFAAKQAGVAVNYSLPASQQGKSVSSAPSSKSASDLINSNQVSDASKKAVDNTPAIRTSIQNYDKVVADITGKNPADLKAPDLPQYEQSYLGLRGQYGIDTLESSMNDLNSQKADIQAVFNSSKTKEQGKPVAMNVIEGRVSEEGQQAQDKIDAIDRQITTITGQLNTAYNVINSLMNFKQMDYSAAKGQYDSEFSQNMQMINLVKGIDDTIKSDAEKAADNARANLQIVYNNISASSQGYKSLSKSEQTMISKLEVQAGLPQGFYKTIESKNPGGQIVTTTSFTDGSNNKYVSVITKDQNGALKTQNLLVGKDSGSSAGNKTDIANANENYIYSALSGAAKGNDGFVDPSVWQAALKKWQDAGGSTSDFFSKFGGKIDNLGKRQSGFINPSNY